MSQQRTLMFVACGPKEEGKVEEKLAASAVFTIPRVRGAFGAAAHLYNSQKERGKKVEIKWDWKKGFEEKRKGKKNGGRVGAPILMRRKD